MGPDGAGGRQAITTPLVDALLMHLPDGFGPCWPSNRLPGLVEELARADQAVLYAQRWESRGGATYGADSTSVARGIDWSAPWTTVVADCRDWTLLEASDQRVDPKIAVTIEWIDESDLRRPVA